VHALVAMLRPVTTNTTNGVTMTDTATTTTSSSSSTTTTTSAPAARPELGAIVYRFTGRLGPLNPVGLFAGGIRFHNSFEGAVVEGPFAGGRISGPDFFVLRPDGVGEIHAPELIEYGAHRIELDVRGYVIPPDGAPVPPLSALLEPGFEFPDVPFRVTGSAFAATASPEFAELNRVTIVIEGEVDMGTGALDVTARRVDRGSS
jgi:hypothetical protein